MASASAPGKVILYGEHAVVFGQPATAVAVDLRAEVYARPHPEWRVDGSTLEDPKYAYLRAAVERAWDGGPLALEIRSQISVGTGLGSSAAVSVATLGVLRGMRGGAKAADIAREAFEVELAVQGRASPVDTSTATAGRGVLVLRQPAEDLLWEIRLGETAWYLHAVDYPPFTLVVGNTGIAAPTGPLVSMVRELAERESWAREAIEEIGGIALDGARALRNRDLVAAGRLMDRNHALLQRLGVSHPLLERFVEAARPFSFGAKLTGAGGGGSMIALTEEPDAVRGAIEAAGGRAFTVATAGEGLRVTP